MWVVPSPVHYCQEYYTLWIFRDLLSFKVKKICNPTMLSLFQELIVFLFCQRPTTISPGQGFLYKRTKEVQQNRAQMIILQTLKPTFLRHSTALIYCSSIVKRNTLFDEFLWKSSCEKIFVIGTIILTNQPWFCQCHSICIHQSKHLTLLRSFNTFSKISKWINKCLNCQDNQVLMK